MKNRPSFREGYDTNIWDEKYVQSCLLLLSQFVRKKCDCIQENKDTRAVLCWVFCEFIHKILNFNGESDLKFIDSPCVHKNLFNYGFRQGISNIQKKF